MLKQNLEKIVFDIDGVLCETIPLIQNFLKQKYNLKDSDFDNQNYSYDMHGWLPNFEGNTQEIMQEVKEFWRNDFSIYEKAIPNQDYCDLVKFLSTNNLFGGYVTRRHPKFYEVTLNWFESQNMPTSNLNMVHPKMYKPEIVKELGLNKMIEDSPEEAFALTQNGINVFLVDHCYNRNMNTDLKIKRIYSAWDVKL